MARIPEDVIDSIRSQADVVDVISDYVTLKKTGRNYLGLCPFHDEKTPSFSVNPERQIFHCFGCGKGGNVFTFLMEHENISFIEAVQQLARRLNIALSDTYQNQEAGSEAESLARVTEFAARFFHNCLLSSAPNSIVRQYTKNRGLSEDIIKAFSLGYAPDAWDKLLNAAKQQNIDTTWLVKAGLAKTSGQRTYDTFRKRLVFPIHSPSGRVVGFGGRALSDDDQPKYLNSPESPIYRKSQVLYGLYQARDTLRKRGQALVVEGYMDLLGLYQHGIDGVVALCGTALTRDQARLLARYAQKTILIYDSDQAGVRATRSAIDPLVESGLWTQIVKLPEGEDPDSYVGKHGSDSFFKLVDQADSIADFMGQHFNVNESVDREEVFRTLTDLIKKTTNLVHRERYREEAESRFPALQGLLASELRSPGSIKRDRRTPPPAKEPSGGGAMVERELLQLILNDRSIAEMVERQLELEDFTNPLYRKIVEHGFEQLSDGRTYDPSSLIDSIDNEQATRIITELINTADSGIHFEQRAQDHIIRIKQKQIKENMGRLMEQIKQMEKDGLSNELNNAMATYMELKQQETALLKSSHED